jgi:hypothetical protein
MFPDGRHSKSNYSTVNPLSKIDSLGVNLPEPCSAQSRISLSSAWVSDPVETGPQGSSFPRPAVARSGSVEDLRRAESSLHPKKSAFSEEFSMEKRNSNHGAEATFLSSRHIPQGHDSSTSASIPYDPLLSSGSIL